MGAGGGAGGAGCAGSLACPLVQAFEASGPAKRLALVLWSCVPSFCPSLSLCLWWLLANMALFRVLRAF